MRKRAYVFGREMIWPKVARRYMESFERARAERRHFAPPGFPVKPLDKRPGELPPLKLDHLRHMTDETGMLQHAIFTVPNYREGYTTDDNARALMVSALLEVAGRQRGLRTGVPLPGLPLVRFQRRDRALSQLHGLPAQLARKTAVRTTATAARCGRWAPCLGHANTPALQSMAGWLFEQALPTILDTTSPRAWAFALIGIHEYLRRFAGDRRAGQVREELAGRLLTLYQDHRSDEWRWFEDGLTYCNAALPHALLLCGRSMANDGHGRGRAGVAPLAGRPAALGRSRRAFRPDRLQRLLSSRRRAGPIRPAARGSPGDGLGLPRSVPDHGRQALAQEARRAFEWFLGRNDLKLPLYDPTTGGCRDGLHPDRPNENQGAESTLAFLQALLELRLAENTLISMDARSL